MTRLERYKQQLADLEAKRGKLVRSGNLVKATALNTDIEEVQKWIKSAEDYERATMAKPLKEFITPEKIHESGVIPMIMECHLAADFLTDCAYNLKDAITELGLTPVSLIPDLDEITKKSSSFAAILCGLNNQNLSDMLTENDSLIQALHKKVVSYINQRSTNKNKKNGAA